MKLSCIIPAKNASKTIEACLYSLKNFCEYVDLEIIVISDGSTDDTGSITRRFTVSSKVENLSVILIETDGVGPGRARNAGLARASGDYVWFCDSDDLAVPDDAQMLVENIEKFQPDVVWANYYVTDGGESSYLTNTFSCTKFYQTIPWSNGHILNTDVNSYKVLWNKLYRRSWISECRASFGSWKTGEDALFNMNTLVTTASLLTLNTPIYSYSRATVGSVTHIGESNGVMINNRCHLIERFSTYLQENTLTQKSVFQTDSYVSQELILLGFTLYSRKVDKQELTLCKLNGKNLTYRIFHANSLHLRYFLKSIFSKIYILLLHGSKA